MERVRIERLPSVRNGVAIGIPHLRIRAPDVLVTVGQSICLRRVDIKVGIRRISRVHGARIQELPTISHAVAIRVGIAGISSRDVLVAVHQIIAVGVTVAVPDQQVNGRSIGKLPTVWHQVTIGVRIVRIGIVDVHFINIPQPVTVGVDRRILKLYVYTCHVVGRLYDRIVGVHAGCFPSIKHAVCVRIAIGRDRVGQQRIEVRERIRSAGRCQRDHVAQRCRSSRGKRINRPRLRAGITQCTRNIYEIRSGVCRVAAGIYLGLVGNAVTVRIPHQRTRHPNVLVTVNETIELNRAERVCFTRVVNRPVSRTRGTQGRRIERFPTIWHAVAIGIPQFGIRSQNMLVAVDQTVGIGRITVGIGNQGIHRQRILHFPTVQHAVTVGIVRVRVGEIDVDLIVVGQTIRVRIRRRVRQNDVDVGHAVCQPDRIVGVGPLRFPGIHHHVAIRVPICRHRVVRQCRQVGRSVGARSQKGVRAQRYPIRCQDIDCTTKAVRIDQVTRDRRRERGRIERIGSGVNFVPIVSSITVAIRNERVGTVSVDLLTVIQAIAIGIGNIRFRAMDIHLGLVV